MLPFSPPLITDVSPPAIQAQQQQAYNEQLSARRQELLRQTRPFWFTMSVLISLGFIIALSGYFLTGSGSRMGLVYTILALACLSAGGIVGFLFGIPNSNQAKRNLAEMAPAGAAPNTDQPSTNLEQVSDWLTKIIIGVGLVEWSRLRNTLVAAGNLVSKETGSRPDYTGGSVVVPQLLIVVFGVLGFACGYIWTRLYYGSVQIELDYNLRQILEHVLAKAEIATTTAQDAAVKAQDAVVKAQGADVKADTLATATVAVTTKANQTEEVVAGMNANNGARDVIPPAQLQAPKGAEAALRPTDTVRDDWDKKLREYMDAEPDFEEDTTNTIFNPNPNSKMPTSQNGRTLVVTKVADLPRNASYFKVEVTGTKDDPLTGEVTLLLHPTFRRRAVQLTADTRIMLEGLATYSFPSTGSFTVVAMADNARTVLGYDLAELPGIPAGW